MRTRLSPSALDAPIFVLAIVLGLAMAAWA